MPEILAKDGQGGRSGLARQNHPLPIECMDADALLKHGLDGGVCGRVGACAVVHHLTFVHDDDVVCMKRHANLVQHADNLVYSDQLSEHSAASPNFSLPLIKVILPFIA